jgi:hypothetical protein
MEGGLGGSKLAKKEVGLCHAAAFPDRPAQRRRAAAVLETAHQLSSGNDYDRAAVSWACPSAPSGSASPDV